MLVIDDDPNALDLLGRTLQGAGVRVVTASDGREARAPGPDPPAGRHHAGRADARHGRLGGAARAEGRSRHAEHPGRHGDA